MSRQRKRQIHLMRQGFIYSLMLVMAILVLGGVGFWVALALTRKRFAK